MKIGIVGSRNFDRYRLMQEIALQYITPEYTTIISGGARGADRLAERLALHLDLNMIGHKAHWDKYGKRAGPIRNQKIVDDSDALLAFPSKKGRGTQITIDMAKRKGIPIYVIDNWEQGINDEDRFS